MKKIIKNILKEETNNTKLKLVKSLIYELFDEVSFIEQSTYNNKPLLKVYFDSDDTAANIESWFGEEICDTIMEYSGNNIILCPSWRPNWDFRKKIVDFYIDAELLKYDNLSNVINEAKYNSQKEIIEKVLNTIVLPEYEHVICRFEVEQHERFDINGEKRFKSPSVTVTFIGGYGTKLWPVTMGIRDMYDKVMNEIWDTIYNYTGIAVELYSQYVKDCGNKNIYLRESKENYSPAGKEIIPNKIVIHKSNPKVRDKISNEGLKVRAGECYKIYAGYGEKCVPAIFATNSTNKRASFDSTYDDDVWEINTEMIPDVKWYKDKHYGSRSKHIVTFENIPVDAITLKHEGTGKDLMRESIDKSEEKKLKIVKDLIHTLFDEVSFIEIKKYGNKPMIRVYFDNNEKANNNEEIYFAGQIQRKIYEYTGIKLIPYWHNIQYNTDADFRLDAIKRKYDNSGNAINESKEPKPKYLSLIKKLVEPFKDEEGVCDINISYDDEDNMYNVYLVIGTEEMNEKFFYVPSMQSHISKLRMNVKNTIKQYIPIDNLYVGSYGKPNCEWKSGVITEKHKVSKDEYVELYRDNDFVLTIPLTHEASKKYGSDTKWCTTTKECDKKFNDHKKYGVLGYITVRDNELKDRLENNAFALYRLYGDDNARTIVFDDQNNEYRNGEQWLSNKFDRFDKLLQFYKMLQKFNSYFESKVTQKENITETDFSRDFKPLPTIQSDLTPKIQSVLNKTMSNTYDWWKGIEIYALRTSGKPYHVLTLNGELTVDKEWGAIQWEKYYDTIPFPGNNEGWEERGYKDEITLGDLTGYKDNSSENIKEDITSVINMTTNLGVIDMQLSTITLTFI